MYFVSNAISYIIQKNAEIKILLIGESESICKNKCSLNQIKLFKQDFGGIGMFLI